MAGVGNMVVCEAKVDIYVMFYKTAQETYCGLIPMIPMCFCAWLDAKKT